MHLLIETVPYSVLHYILGVVLMALPIRSPCIAFEMLDNSQTDPLFENNMGLSDTGNIENKASQPLSCPQIPCYKWRTVQQLQCLQETVRESIP